MRMLFAKKPRFHPGYDVACNIRGRAMAGAKSHRLSREDWDALHDYYGISERIAKPGVRGILIDGVDVYHE